MNLKRNIVGRCGLDSSPDKWLDVVNTAMNLRDPYRKVF